MYSDLSSRTEVHGTESVGCLTEAANSHLRDRRSLGNGSSWRAQCTGGKARLLQDRVHGCGWFGRQRRLSASVHRRVDAAAL